MKPIISKPRQLWDKIYGLWEFKTDFKKYLTWKYHKTKTKIEKRGIACDNLYYYAQLDLLREINKQYNLRSIK